MDNSSYNSLFLVCRSIDKHRAHAFDTSVAPIIAICFHLLLNCFSMLCVYLFFSFYRLTYLVCITILTVSILIVYCIVRRKMSVVGSYGHQNLSKIMFDDIMKITSFRRALQDDMRNV